MKTEPSFRNRRRTLKGIARGALLIPAGYLLWRFHDARPRVYGAPPGGLRPVAPLLTGPTLNFLTFGDQGHGNRGQRLVANLMNEQAKSQSVSFVTLLGDNIYENGVDSHEDPKWRTHFERIYDLSHLDLPFYAILGNHDYRTADGRFQIGHRDSRRKWQMPARYYKFSKRIARDISVDFFALDTVAIKDRDDRAQLRWLDDALSDSVARRRIVFGHHPLISYGRHGTSDHLIERLGPILARHDVDLYLCGHDHDRQYLGPIDGVRHVVCGTGSEGRDVGYGPETKFASTGPGFLLVQLSETSTHIRFIDEAGAVEFGDSWTSASAQAQQAKQRLLDT